jgi:xylulokinase
MDSRYELPGNPGYKRIKKILFTKDYVRSYVTGDYYTDIVDAQGSLLFDVIKKEWSKEICDTIELPLEVLPCVKSSTTIVGCVSKAVSELTGLPEGVPVITGCSDTAAEDYGAGAILDGQLIVKLATAGNVNIITDTPRPHSKTYTYPYAMENMWYTVTGTNSSAASYRWLRDALYSAEKADLEAKNEDVYVLMDKNASEVDVGSGGLIFHPYLNGERCPYFNPKARGSFFGITVNHDKRHFTRAVLEGVAFSLYDCFLVLSDFNMDMKDIRIIGGGAKSPLWCQIVSDVFGLVVIQPLTAESSFGGALLAGVGVGVFENELSAAEKCVKIKKIFTPDMNNHQKYKKLFEVYKKVVMSSLEAWENLYEICRAF